MVWPALSSTGAARVEVVKARREMSVAVMDFILVFCCGLGLVRTLREDEVGR